MPVLRHIFDPATGSYHDVEVSQEVYDFFRRNAWAIRRNDTRFYTHEIQFSSLKGGQDDSFERFDEFSTSKSDPQELLCLEAEQARLINAFQGLSSDDQDLLYWLVIEGRSERWYGKRMNMHFMTIHNRKISALQRFQRLYLNLL